MSEYADYACKETVNGKIFCPMHKYGLAIPYGPICKVCKQYFYLKWEKFVDELYLDDWGYETKTKLEPVLIQLLNEK